MFRIAKEPELKEISDDKNPKLWCCSSFPGRRYRQRPDRQNDEKSDAMMKK